VHQSADTSTPSIGFEIRLSDSRKRAIGFLVAVGAIGILMLAAGLKPDHEGHGTHQQLGLAPCPWVLRWNFPCPSCGMTTAFAHAANGDLKSSGATQPFGMLLAVGASVLAWGGLHAGIRGVDPMRLIPRGNGRAITIGAISLFLIAWVYKMIVW